MKNKTQSNHPIFLANSAIDKDKINANFFKVLSQGENNIR